MKDFLRELWGPVERSHTSVAELHLKDSFLCPDPIEVEQKSKGTDWLRWMEQASLRSMYCPRSLLTNTEVLPPRSQCWPRRTVIKEWTAKVSPCLLRAMSGYSQQFSRSYISTSIFHPYSALPLATISPGTGHLALTLKFHPSCLDSIRPFLSWLMLLSWEPKFLLISCTLISLLSLHGYLS